MRDGNVGRNTDTTRGADLSIAGPIVKSAPAPALVPAATASLWPWLAFAVAVVVLDQITKFAVLARFAEGERLPVIPGFFDLTLWYNPGAAFSFLSSHSGWQRWLFAGIAIVASLFIVHLLRRHAAQRPFALALSLVLGGAIGNLIDRFVHGQVVDFLLFHHGAWAFPAFNVADSAITVGAVLLIVDELFLKRRAPSPTQSTSPP